MTDSSTLPATQKDIQFVLKQLTSLLDEKVGTLQQEVRESNIYLVERIGSLEVQMDEKMNALKDDLITQFSLIAENMRYDFLGAHKDDIQSLKIKVARLEEHTGFANAV